MWIKTALGLVGDLGKGWLENKKDEAKARSDLLITQMRNAAAAQATEAQNNATADQINLRANGKSWWDEFLCLIALSPLIYTVVYSWIHEGTPAAMWAAIASVPVWYMILIGAIYVNYLGMRGLATKAFTVYMASRGGRGFDLAAAKKLPSVAKQIEKHYPKSEWQKPPPDNAGGDDTTSQPPASSLNPPPQTNR